MFQFFIINFYKNMIISSTAAISIFYLEGPSFFKTKFWICLATFTMTHAEVQARAEHKRWQHGQLLARAIAKEVAREIQSTTYYCLKIETWGGNWSINPVFKKKSCSSKRCYKCVLYSFNSFDIQAKQFDNYVIFIFLPYNLRNIVLNWDLG